MSGPRPNDRDAAGGNCVCLSCCRQRRVGLRRCLRRMRVCRRPAVRCFCDPLTCAVLRSVEGLDRLAQSPAACEGFVFRDQCDQLRAAVFVLIKVVDCEVDVSGCRNCEGGQYGSDDQSACHCVSPLCVCPYVCGAVWLAACLPSDEVYLGESYPL